MLNNKHILLGLLLVSCTSQPVENLTITIDGKTEQLPLHTVISENLTIPESVTIHKGTVYVANIGGNPLQSPKLGYIAQIKNNKVTKFFEGKLDDPKGFVFLTDDIILVSDHPTIKLLRISTGEIISSSVEAGFLNDMVKLDAYNVLLSDTGTGIIHHIIIDSNYTTISHKPLEGITENGINGLAFDKTSKTLYFVTSTFGGDSTRGHIFEATLSDDFTSIKNIEQWNMPQLGAGGLDGVVLSEKTLIVSDWGVNAGENSAKLFAFDRNTRENKFTIHGNITSVADITLDKTTLYLPEFLKHKVTKINLDKYL